MIKGAKEYKKWKENKPLTRKEAMTAQCYICNGEEEGRVDCQGSKSCPMYAYALYPNSRPESIKKPATEKMRASLKLARERAAEARKNKKELK